MLRFNFFLLGVRLPRYLFLLLTHLLLSTGLRVCNAAGSCCIFAESVHGDKIGNAIVIVRVRERATERQIESVLFIIFWNSETHFSPTHKHAECYRNCIVQTECQALFEIWRTTFAIVSLGNSVAMSPFTKRRTWRWRRRSNVAGLLPLHIAGEVLEMQKVA